VKEVVFLLGTLLEEPDRLPLDPRLALTDWLLVRKWNWNVGLLLPNIDVVLSQTFLRCDDSLVRVIPAFLPCAGSQRSGRDPPAAGTAALPDQDC